MASAVRSPGSALKPLIYGLAFEQGIVHPADHHRGQAGQHQRLSARQFRHELSGRRQRQDGAAAVAERAGHSSARCRRAAASGVTVGSGRGRLRAAGRCCPGLPIGIGGLGLTLLDLAELYTIFPNRGRVAVLGTGVPQGLPAQGPGREILSPAAAWYVSDILAGVAPPEGAARQGFAYKTGTSFGFRDSWAVGFDGRFVLAVWAGRRTAPRHRG